MPTGIIGLGSYVPDRVVGNDTVAEWAGVTPQWITERTGIESRRYADEHTATSDLAVRAAARLLAEHPDAARRIGAVVLATCTPDVPQPSTAAIVQHKLGLASVPSFDLNAVCCGFLYGLAVADGLRSGITRFEYTLLVGADKFSTIIDRTDRRTVSLFGDGAGAVLLGPVPAGYGLLAVRMVTDGDLHHLVGVRAGGSALPLDEQARAAGHHLLHMDGRSIRKYIDETLPRVVDQVLDEAGLGLADISRFVFHQANTRILEAYAEAAGIDRRRMAMTAPRWGNTAGGSIPVTLHATAGERPMERGEHLLMASIGGGMTAAAAIVRWY